MKLKVFTKKDCPNCPPAKKVIKELENSGIPIEYFDTEEIDGMTEGSYYMVMATPTTDEKKEEDSEAPKSEAVESEELEPASEFKQAEQLDTSALEQK
jgi:glutaredoxin